MTRYVQLASLELGDVEELRILGTDRHISLEATIDGCESVTVLDRTEAVKVRDTLTAWIEGNR